MISRLEDFSARIANRLDDLDRPGMQETIRILVRRIEIDDNQIEVVFRVPPRMGRPASRPAMTPRVGNIVQALVERTFKPRQTPRQRLRGDHQIRTRLAPRRPRVSVNPTPRKALRSAGLNFESGSQPAGIVYLRQSGAAQVENNRESTDRQYALAAKARELG